jgi:hypothetical protein
MTMIEEEPRTPSVVDLFGEEDVVAIAKPCEGCGNVHAEHATFVQFMNYVSSLGAINFN